MSEDVAGSFSASSRLVSSWLRWASSRVQGRALPTFNLPRVRREFRVCLSPFSAETLAENSRSMAACRLAITTRSGARSRAASRDRILWWRLDDAWGRIRRLWDVELRFQPRRTPPTRDVTSLSIHSRLSRFDRTCRTLITQGSTRRLSTTQRGVVLLILASSQRERKSTSYFRCERSSYRSDRKGQGEQSNVRKHVERVARLPQHPTTLAALL